MTNIEIYQALSRKGRRGAKKKVLQNTGLSVNMLTRVLKHGHPSEHEALIVQESLRVIEKYEAQEREVAEMRVLAAKKLYLEAQTNLQLTA